MAIGSFAVIIPFYQKQAGLLRLALQSVAEQDVSARVNVYVVDDESPVPPEPEVAAIAWPGYMSVSILKRANGGPAAARNTGLDHLNDEAFVAFLDSDDMWKSHHLSSAAFGLGRGYLFYTADAEMDKAGARYHATYYPSLDGPTISGAEWAYEPKVPLINLVVSGPIAKLDAMVVARDLIGIRRFDEDLTSAGEDGLFGARLAVREPRTMISRRVDVVTGHGVNVFSAGCWGSRSSVIRHANFLTSRIRMVKLLDNFPEARAQCVQQIARGRRKCWGAFLAAARRRNVDSALAREMLRIDRGIWTGLPGAAREALGAALYGTRKGESRSDQPR